ncbi:MAG: sigma-54-dependent Fis family transcriptional regulator [Desulfobacterales bacterium]|nr:sigma-54-dependent Fis family transcriptional regulator [Desulfobacterales bacterium]MBF0398968.1 sigma-54-dependent Fis family transcriptional regulator [Desulfobacterales bacterium]
MIGNILIIDDEKDMLTLLKRIISEETKHKVTTESDPIKALELFSQRHFDIVITDLKMPKIDGIKLLEEVKKISPDVSVIILTAFATIETAIDAIRKGAYDYITKPFKRELILLTLDKAIKWQEMVIENKALRQELAEKEEFSSLVGSTPIMKGIFERIHQVAPTMGTVLITGPSGTGKELVAVAIHKFSMRRDKKLITINCTAIPEQMLESELFGHIKGAFTGAWQDKKGLVEEACGGTLFLDEIGDLSSHMQTKLLRLLQEGEYKPVGSVTTKKADLRFIAATNHDLKSDIKAGSFREDLYYRLNVIRFELPQLKHRKQDIPILSYHFLKKYNRINQKNIKNISPETMQVLISLEYQGNVRELENIIERGVIFCRKDSLEVKDLQLDTEHSVLFSDFDEEIGKLNFKDAKDKMIQNFHKVYIQSLLAKSGGNISKAAESAGIQRQYLHRLIKESDIRADSFKFEDDDLL